MKGCIKLGASLSDDAKLQTAELIYNSLPIFYDLLTISEEERINLIGSQLTTEGVEIFDTKAFRDGSKILGVYTAFPSDNLKIVK